MKTMIPAHRRKIPVCLVGHNPLALYYLSQILRVDRDIKVSCQDDTFDLRNALNTNGCLFVLDCFALPNTLRRCVDCLRRRIPGANILVIGGERSTEELVRLLFLGVRGFLQYSEVQDRLRRAIQEVWQGHLWMSQEALERYVRFSSDEVIKPKGKGQLCLTERETKIVEFVQQKLANKEISAALGISESTVKFHLANIFTKLGVRDRHSLVEILNSRSIPASVPRNLARPAGNLLLDDVRVSPPHKY